MGFFGQIWSGLEYFGDVLDLIGLKMAKNDQKFGPKNWCFGEFLEFLEWFGVFWTDLEGFGVFWRGIVK